jgi:hypothetical protein
VSFLRTKIFIRSLLLGMMALIQITKRLDVSTELPPLSQDWYMFLQSQLSGNLPLGNPTKGPSHSVLPLRILLQRQTSAVSVVKLRHGVDLHFLARSP